MGLILRYSVPAGTTTSNCNFNTFAALETLDHDIPLNCLHHLIDLEGTTLDWVASYLRDRSFSVIIQDLFSSAWLYFYT